MIKKFVFALAILICSFSKADPLLRPRQAALVNKSMLTGPNTNRVQIVTASKLIGLTNFSWTAMMYQTNADRIVTVPGSLLIVPPSNAVMTIEWSIPMTRMVSSNFTDWIPETVMVRCISKLENDSAQKYVKVQTDSYGNPPVGQSLNLFWNSSPSPEVVGYNVYYGPNTQIYTNTISIGDVTNFNLAGLAPGGTYYIAVTARDQAGSESDMSNEVSATTVIPSDSLSIRNP